MRRSTSPIGANADPSDGCATFHNAYRLLMAKAAESGLLPNHGLTPREQRDRLADGGVLSAAHISLLRRLTDLLELCVYARAGTLKQVEEGMTLCLTLESAIPVPPTPH